MKAYQNERRENIIAYLAKRHRMALGEAPYQTHIYKYLGMFEYRCLRELGYLPLGYTYRAMENGPVPEELYFNRTSLKTEHFEFRSAGEGKYTVHPVRDADLDYFSEDELEILNKLILQLTRRKRESRTAHFSERSHEEIRAWREAWQRQENSIMNPDDEFADLDSVREGERSPAELHYSIEKVLHGSRR